MHDSIVDLNDERHVRLCALDIAAEGVGKTRFNPDSVLAAAAKFADYITDGTIPEPEPKPVRAIPPGPTLGVLPDGAPRRGRGRPRKATGEGG